MTDPLRQFALQTWISCKIGSWWIPLTNGAFFMIIACATPLILLSWGLRGKNLVPSRFQALCEWPLAFIQSMLGDVHLEERYLSFILTIFIFVFMGNFLGMLPYGFTFTSHIVTTFTLAISIFILITLWGLVLHRGKFFRLFCPAGVPKSLLILLIPIEVLSYLSRPISLSVRLFANMMAGHTMLKVFAGFSVMMGMWGVAPLILNIILVGFEILVAFLQAYVFSILSCLYLKDVLTLH